jgi:hypothetical protein
MEPAWIEWIKKSKDKKRLGFEMQGEKEESVSKISRCVKIF